MTDFKNILEESTRALADTVAKCEKKQLEAFNEGSLKMPAKFVHVTDLNRRTSGIELAKPNEVSPKLWEVAKAICEATVGAGATDAEITIYLFQARAAMAVYEADEQTIVQGANLVRDTAPHINWHGCKKISKDLHAYFINGVYGDEH